MAIAVGSAMVGGARARAWLRGLRLALFLAIFAFMMLGPFYKQVLGGRDPLFRQWTMFSRMGLGLADVRFSQRLPDGTRVDVDHYEVLGHRDWREAPLALRQVMGLEGVQRVADQLCDALGPGTDLRARARIAYRPGWRTEMLEADGNLCAERANATQEGERGAIGD